MVEGKSDVRAGDSEFVICETAQLVRFTFISDECLQVSLGSSNAIFSDDHVWLDEEVLAEIFYSRLGISWVYLSEVDLINFVIAFKLGDLGNIINHGDSLRAQHIVNTVRDLVTHVIQDLRVFLPHENHLRFVISDRV